jgi:hypothetical protein
MSSILLLPPVNSYWEEEGGFNGGVFTPQDGSEPRVLIYDLVNIQQAVSWGQKSIPGASDRFNGAPNTRAILEAEPDHPIAKHIAALDVNGHTDFYWASIFELTHLFVTAGEKIYDTLDRYGVWSSTQYAGLPSGAWMQDFGNGGQYWDRKGLEFGAVAVRSKLLNY